MIAILIALFAHHDPAPVVVPEGLIITAPTFEAIWVPEGVVGPIVAAPFDAEAFEVNGG